MRNDKERAPGIRSLSYPLVSSLLRPLADM